MAEEWYAHTPPEHDRQRWHKLEDHLQAVADMAAEFGAAFGAEHICRALGASHDLGKRDPRFQAYLHMCAKGERGTSVPHAAAGAAASMSVLGPFALAILGHHTGIPDKADAQSRLASADPVTVQAARAGAAILSRPEAPSWADSPRSAELLVRMCFSALTDADYLDTERHMNPALATQRQGAQPLSWYEDALRRHLMELRASAPPSEVNAIRNEVLDACYRAAEDPPQAYRLTVPTGGGKTLASLTFALRHAVRHDLRRVIVAIPYTSIIDQTATVYAKVFGSEHVLAHHSGYDPGDDTEEQSLAELRRKLATENWDVPLVVTTTVQLFDSLFSNRPKPCRKLHRIARSVIILDEAQTLPPELLDPILDVLGELIRHYGCSVVFCTATQPDYSALAGTLLANAQEIVPSPERYFDSLRRVRYTRAPAPLTIAEVASRLDAENQALCILNTRKDAVRIALACRRDDALFHLSTLMCPD
ncbi:MAG: CRISPR-associated endonuclease Cas3'', partial [Chthonomonadales bacterium]|nr:CRISPR-associated endonuclease Cas3'' [Chthonomonadales bacterium]